MPPLICLEIIQSSPRMVLPIHWSIGHAMQESTESHKMLLALKDAVEKYSDGKITITIYPNSSWAATLK